MAAYFTHGSNATCGSTIGQGDHIGAPEGARSVVASSTSSSLVTLTLRLLERLKKEGRDIEAFRMCVQESRRRRLPRLTKSHEEGA